MATDEKTLILFGISGVGKSTAAKAMVARFPSLLHFQASELLKAAHNRSGETLRTADPKQISQNQSVLSESLREARISKPGAPVIMDAHSVIDNDKGLVDLELDVFVPITPNAICFLEDEPSLIAARRVSDNRSRPERSVLQLAEYQARAKSVAKTHAATLGIPFAAIVSSDHDGLADFIGRIIG